MKVRAFGKTYKISKRTGSVKKFRKNYKTSLSKRIARIENAERQCISTLDAQSDVVTTGQYYRLVSPIVQGDDVGNRQGQRIAVKSISATVFLSHTTTFTTALQTFLTVDQVVRIIFFRWKQPKGATFTNSSLLTNTSSNLALCLSKYNPNTINQFQIIFDRHYVMGINATAKQLPFLLKWSYKPPVKNSVSVFGGNTGNADSIQTNDYYILIYTSNVTGVGATVVTDTLNLADGNFTAVRFLG